VTTASASDAIAADRLWKRFGTRDVVRDVSFRIRPGEIVGMVGPNGAGKTTSIRMVLNILRPDRGTVTIDGRPLDQQAQEAIGYLPEERGLYRDVRVIPMLQYLGELKGMTRDDARRRADVLLDRLGMTAHRAKQVRELSRGMTQLIAFAGTILHEPDVIVLDEPFSGLDPVNVRLMKTVVGEQQARGAATLFSTHQMTDVEELCDRVIMIDQGTVVLDDLLVDVKRRFRGDRLFMVTDTPPAGDDGVTGIERDGGGYSMRLLRNIRPEAVLARLLQRGARIERFEVEMPSLEDIFLRMVRDRRG